MLSLKVNFDYYSILQPKAEFQTIIGVPVITPDRRQSKTLILLTNVDHKWLETEFLIAICCLTDDKWQSKTLFLEIVYLRPSIVKCFRLPPTWCGNAYFQNLTVKSIFELAHMVLVLMALWSSEGAGELAHMHRLHRAFAAHIHKVWI